MAKILIADDHDLVRDTIAAYLSRIDDFDVKSAASLDEALDVMRGIDAFDLAILDYHMPGMDGLSGLDRAQRAFPATKVALMSGVANRDVAEKAMALGAYGFIPKSLTATTMVNAIRFVLLGERYMPVEFGAEDGADAPRHAFVDLSKREQQTLELLCVGLTNKEIARNLGIQEVTVKLHVKNLLSKLGVSNRTQAALLAKEKHLI